MTEKKYSIDTDALLDELSSLKRLMILFLLKSGATQTEIGLTLGVNKSTVSRMLPLSKINKFSNVD